MTEPAPTISIRIPLSRRKSLDKVAKATRRSRSFIINEALERHMADIAREQKLESQKPLSHLLSMAGIAAKLGQKPRSREEIDAHIRWLRDDG